MDTATITSKGQITIPKTVRDRLGLRTGDKVVVSVLAEGAIKMTPKTARIEDVKGMLARYAGGRKVSVEEMDRGIAAGLRRGAV